MTRTRYFYDYSPTLAQSEAVGKSIGHHFRIEGANKTFEIGALPVLATQRPLFMALTLRLQRHDALVCRSVCSLGSTPGDLMLTLTLLRDLGVQTHCPMGTFISLSSYQVALQMLRGLASVEASIRADRTSRSMRSAGQAGVKLGRPATPALNDPATVREILRRLQAGETQTAVAASVGVHRRSLSRLIQQQGIDGVERTGLAMRDRYVDVPGGGR